MAAQPRNLIPALLLAAGFATAAAGQELNAPAARPKPAPAPIEAAPARKRPPINVGTLSNGLRLLCRSDNSSEIVSVVCLIRAGLPDEREDQAGLAALTAEALAKGTTTHPGSSFMREIIAAGGNIHTQPGWDFTEISVVTSKDQFEGAIKLIGDVVAHPQFAAEGVKEAKETLNRRAISFQDDFTGASYQSLTAQLYPHTPYGRAMNGYPQTVEKLTPADVKAFWQANYVQSRMVVAVVGDVDSSRALTLAQNAFKAVPFRAKSPAAPAQVEHLAKPRYDLIQRDGPAAQVMAGFLAPAATAENYATYSLIDAIIGGGKRARLFSNIREKQSLGYDLGAFYQPLLNQSHLVAYVVTPPFRRNPKTEEAEPLIDKVKGLLFEQYQQLAATGPTDVELARARAYVVGRQALRQERTRDQAKWLAWNEAMGLGRNFDDTFPQRVQAVTKEQIQAAAKGLISQYAIVVTVPEGK